MSHFSKKKSTVPSSFSSASMQISGKGGGGGLLLRLVELRDGQLYFQLCSFQSSLIMQSHLMQRLLKKRFIKPQQNRSSKIYQFPL